MKKYITIVWNTSNSKSKNPIDSETFQSSHKILITINEKGEKGYVKTLGTIKAMPAALVTVKAKKITLVMPIIGGTANTYVFTKQDDIWQGGIKIQGKKLIKHHCYVAIVDIGY